MEDWDIQDKVGQIIQRNIENFDFSKISPDADSDEIVDDMHHIVYDTDLVDLAESKMTDLCIWNDQEYGGEGVPAGTEWDMLSQVRANVAESSLYLLVESNLRDFLRLVQGAFEAEGLSLNSIVASDPYSMAAPSSSRDGDDFTVLEYRNLDGSFNADVYTFDFDLEGAMVSPIQVTAVKILPES